MSTTFNAGNPNTYLSNLIANSADAQSNLYMVRFNLPAIMNNAINGLQDQLEAVTVRTKNFNWAQPSQEPYEVKFLTAKINRPKAFIKVEHSFDFTMRVDNYYNTYKAILYLQKHTNFNPEEGWALNDITGLENYLFDASVFVIDRAVAQNKVEDTDYTRLVKFEKCWVDSIDPISFKNGDSNPVEIKVNCKFLYLDNSLDREASNSSSVSSQSSQDVVTNLNNFSEAAREEAFSAFKASGKVPTTVSSSLIESFKKNGFGEK